MGKTEEQASARDRLANEELTDEERQELLVASAQEREAEARELEQQERDEALEAQQAESEEIAEATEEHVIDPDTGETVERDDEVDEPVNVRRAGVRNPAGGTI
jgi:hypothetical protein